MLTSAQVGVPRFVGVGGRVAKTDGALERETQACILELPPPPFNLKANTPGNHLNLIGMRLRDAARRDSSSSSHPAWGG